MTLEQVAEIGWDTKLPPSLEDALTVLETASKSYVFDDLGVDFLNMDLAFKRLEEKQASEKTEERLAVLSRSLMKSRSPWERQRVTVNLSDLKKIKKSVPRPN